MGTYCEIVVTSVLPAIRSIITKELIEKHKLTQEEAAELLGITQPAISQYKKEARGVKVRLLEKNQELMNALDKLIKDILNKNISERELERRLCSICRNLKSDNPLVKSKKINVIQECPFSL